ncbi:AbiV family abortive infection protein [Quatrionicoccus australiensis]|uniref:AbiV family abortive infection protein n=1 Tax=Quatrionicoccus australiensis TaxID=138118 RepID=UPI001CF8791F|nr:AbiV family abortive infection protein [Quatrionicoccus australiensis]UCV14163.1 AbiV family abortive infection protein [Quatrionicoccus australiensis]
MSNDRLSEWVSTVDDNLSAKLKEASLLSYANACSLLDDAATLYSANRFPRAAALAILAEEEFSKSFVLCVSVQEKRWDSALLRGLRDHAPKQAIAKAMRTYAEWVKINEQRVAAMNQYSLIPALSSRIPTDEEMSEMFEEIKTTHIKRRSKDRQKQNFLYVAIARDGSTSNNPSSTTKDESKSHLDSTQEFKLISEHMLSHTISGFKPRP